MAQPVSKAQGGGPGRRTFSKPATQTTIGPGGSTRAGSRTAAPPPTAKQRAEQAKQTKVQDKARATASLAKTTKTNASKKAQGAKQHYRRLVNEQGMSHRNAYMSTVDKFGQAVSETDLKNAVAGSRRK